MANVLKSLYEQGKALVAPEDSEAESIKEKQSNVDQYKSQYPSSVGPMGTALTPVAKPAPTALGSARYGDRPGEQRIDTSSMTSPLGSAVSHHAEGGKLNPNEVNVVGEEGPEAVVGDEVVPLEHSDERNPLMQEEEKVEGAPADFGGPVLPNPNHVRPMLDTEKPEIPKATVNMDASNPAKAQVIPGEEEKQSGQGAQSTLSSTATGTARPKTMGSSVAPEESNSPLKLASDQANSQAADVSAQRAQIHEDKKAATAKGDLVGLGMAKIHENELNKSETARHVLNEATSPAPDVSGEASQRTEQGAGLGSAVANPTVEDIRAGSEGQKPEDKAQLDFQRSLLSEDKLSKDPSVRGSAKVQEAELAKQNPYGSKANHPGVLGKIEHGLATAGNIAGNALIPNVMPSIPGSKANIAAKEQQGQAEVEQGEKNKLTESEVAKNQAMAKLAGVGKTVQERVFQDKMRGGPNGGPQINPDTQPGGPLFDNKFPQGRPYTEDEAALASQGTGKTVDEETIQSLMKTPNPETGKPYTRLEAQKDVLQTKAGTKPKPQSEQRLLNHMAKMGIEDTPQNRDAARVDMERGDVEAKANAALPIQEQHDKFKNQIAESKTALDQVRADALARGKTGDELQIKENERHSLALKPIQDSKDALEHADQEQLAASIVPVITTMTTSVQNGIKRLNPQELRAFTPANGNLYRWAEANVDKFMSGQIPPEYKTEVAHMLTRMEARENAEHLINSGAVDELKNSAIQPKVNPKGKVTGTEKPAARAETEQKKQEVPADLPKGATHIYRDKQGNVKGYALNGKFQAYTAK